METIISIINQQKMNIQMKDDEYLKDGIIYCKKCNTPRQAIIDCLGTERKVRCMCKCQSDEYQKEQQLIKDREHLERVNKLKVKSLLGKRYENASFNKCEKTGESFNKALYRCKKYCEVSDEVLKNGYGIYLYGDSGTGKTHLTACMCNELTNGLKQCLFTNFSEISKAIRSTFNKKSETEENLINNISNVDFLFIDDLGTEILQKNGDDTWLQEKVYDIINKRYNAKKPTIFTSNYSLQELINERGMMKKTVDRILEMSNAIMKIDGESYRKRIKKELPF